MSKRDPKPMPHSLRDEFARDGVSHVFAIFGNRYIYGADKYPEDYPLRGWDDICALAYQFADAMLAERAKP